MCYRAWHTSKPGRPEGSLIAGTSSGIGAATAERVVAAGHRVVLGTRRVEGLAAVAEKIRANGGAADHDSLDVTDPASVNAFVQATRARHGRIDALVNNAGVIPLSRLDALRVDEWDQMIDVNLRGVLNGVAAVLPIMREQGSGHVLGPIRPTVQAG